MIDRDITAVATLLTTNDIHQSAIAELLIRKGVITQEELDTIIDADLEEKFKAGVEQHSRAIREMTRHKEAKS